MRTITKLTVKFCNDSTFDEVCDMFKLPMLDFR